MNSKNLQSKPMAIQHEKRSHRRTEIDGIRGMAAIPVILYHLHIYFDHDITRSETEGVAKIFFLLSGFVLTCIFLKQFESNTFKWLPFVKLRVRRLCPMVLGVFVILLPIGWCFFDKELFLEMVDEMFFTLLNLQNFFLYSKGSARHYWTHHAEAYPLLTFWSLAVSEQFACFFYPLLITLTYKIFGRWFRKNRWEGTRKQRYLYLVLLFTFISALSGWLCIEQLQSRPGFYFYLLPARLWQFMLGCITAVCLDYYKLREIQNIGGANKIKGNITSVFDFRLGSGIICDLLSWIGFFCFVGTYLADATGTYPVLLSLLPLIGVLMIIIFNYPRFDPVSNERKMLSSAKFFSIRPFTFLGEISFELYLLHFPIWVLHCYLDNIGQQIHLLFKVAVIFKVLVLSWFAYRFFVIPFRDEATVSSVTFWKGLRTVWLFLLCVTFFLGFNEIDNHAIHRYGANATHKLDPDLLNVDIDGVYAGNIYLDTPSVEIDNFFMESKADKPYFDYIFNVSDRVGDDRFISPYFQPLIINPRKHTKGYGRNAARLNGRDRVCIAVLGSSIAVQYGPIIEELSLELNKSVAFLTLHGDSGRFDNPLLSEYNKARRRFLRDLNPKRIFYSDHFSGLFHEHTRTRLTGLVSNLLHTSPTKVVIFGQPPSVSLFQRNVPFIKHIRTLRETEEFDLQILKELEDEDGSLRRTIEGELVHIITTNPEFQGKHVKFYPISQFYLSNSPMKPTQKEPYLQILGNEVEGRALFYDKEHLTYEGTLRVKQYLKSKVFDGIHC